ncbi:MAG TPA: bifunctional demethylmenaquinone methyltransferase/2-methoxy-6-polyprenyl-1,4-benzoquinol methylase UbiE [Bacteroidia bacterium]
MSQEPVTPYHSGESKKQQVATMFNKIANRYDTLNQVMSVGIHHKWRKKAVDTFVDLKPEYVLDIATGTGDFAIAALRANPKKVTGVDISQGMLDFGKEKIKKANLENKVVLSLGDAENLNFPDNSFDVITVGFGVRNFENLELGLSNMLRVLKPGGKVVILEFSKPRGFFKYMYNIYFLGILPLIGKIFSKDNAAYTYLPESVQAFPDFENFTAIMAKVGYKTPKYKALTFGVACIYTATK